MTNKRDPKLEKAAEVCVNIVRRRFPNCSVKRNETNDNSVSITFNNFESEDSNSEYDENGKLKKRRERKKMAYVFHANKIQQDLQRKITDASRGKLLCRILLTRDESGKFINSLTVHIKQRKMFQRNAFKFDKKLEDYKLEFDDILNEGFFDQSEEDRINNFYKNADEKFNRLEACYKYVRCTITGSGTTNSLDMVGFYPKSGKGIFSFQQSALIPKCMNSGKYFGDIKQRYNKYFQSSKETKKEIKRTKEEYKNKDKKISEGTELISSLLEKLKIFEEKYNIYNEGLFSVKQPISLKEATPKLKEQIKQLKDQGYDFAHVNWIKHEEPDTYNYYKKNGLIVKIDEIYCFIKGTKEDIKSVNVYLINKQDAVIVKKLKFK